MAYDTGKMEKIGAVMRNYRLKHKNPELQKSKVIARRMGKQQTAVLLMESGKRPIQLEVFLDWCDALELKPRSVIEKCHEALTGQHRPHLSKRQLEIREAKKILAAGNAPLRS